MSTLSQDIRFKDEKMENKDTKVELIIEGIFKFSHILDLQKKLKEMTCISNIQVRYILNDVVNMEITCDSRDELANGIQSLNQINLSVIEQQDNFFRIKYHLPPD